MDAPIPPNDREPKGSWSRTLVLPRVTRRDPRARRDALIGAAVAICLGLIFLTPQFGGSLIALSYDLAYKFRPKATINEAVLVYMDDESHGVLKQPYDQGWDRRVHARMVNRLMSYGAQAVVFDVLFRDDRTNSASGRLDDSEDGEFMAALRASGHVVLGATVQRKSYGTIGKVAEMIGPTPNLQTVAHVGLAEAGLKEEIYRQHFVFETNTTMAWMALQLTMTNPPITWQQRRVEFFGTSTESFFANLFAPEPGWMNFYGPPDSLPHFSYQEVLNNQIAPEHFRNKVVFIGGNVRVAPSGGKEVDNWLTPYSRFTGDRAPGTELCATAYLNLLRGDWLSRTAPLIELLIIGLVGGVFGAGLSFCKLKQSAPLAILALPFIALAAVVIVWHSFVWFPWMTCEAQVIGALLWSVVTSGKREEKVRRELEEALHAATLQLANSQSARGSAMTAALPPGDAPTNLGPQPAEAARISDHTLIHCIDEGAYGEVWLARDAIGTYRAVKVIRRSRFKNARPFEREFDGIKNFAPISLDHPGFVHVLHIGLRDAEGFFFYIMEAADDRALGQKIHPHSYKPRTLSSDLRQRRYLPVSECVEIGLSLLRALEHLHAKSYLHRDIKPANIIFIHGQAKLADIGLVARLRAEGESVTMIGTDGYMAPEGPRDFSSDLYSLGKVLYEAATGLDRKKFASLPADLDQRPDFTTLLKLNEIFSKACEPDPRDRYRTATEMREALERLKQTAPTRV